MKPTTQQLNIFDYQPPVETPDFGGDFEKEMDYIASLSGEERLKLMEKEGDEKW